MRGGWRWPEHHLLVYHTTDQWHLWDLHDLTEIYSEKHDTNVLAFTFSPSQRRRIEYTRDHGLQFRSAPGGHIEPFLKQNLGNNPHDVRLAISTDGRLMAAARPARCRFSVLSTHPQIHDMD